MPTTRLRHQITETPRIARAIDLAARRWPGESRAQLLRRLVTVAGTALEGDEGSAATIRQEAIQASSGKYAVAFGPEYLDELRGDWPS